MKLLVGCNLPFLDIIIVKICSSDYQNSAMASYKGAGCHFSAHVEGLAATGGSQRRAEVSWSQSQLPAPAPCTWSWCHLRGPSAALVISQSLEPFCVLELAQCASPVPSLTPCGDFLTGSNWEVEADK